MSFLKQLLTPFVEFEDDSKKNAAPASKPTAPFAAPTATPPAAPVPVKPSQPEPTVPAHHPLINNANNPVNAPAPTVAPTPTYAPGGTMATPLPEHEHYFEKLIDEANRKDPLFQGTDYKEFVDSKVDIDGIQDEALRYKTAYNVLKSTGLTKEKLLATGQEYLNVIGRDLNAFQSAHAQQYLKEVKQKEQTIQKKAEELQTLTQRINALKAEINQITQDINLTKDQLNTTKNSFLLAGENKQKEIQTELQKIAQYF